MAITVVVKNDSTAAVGIEDLGISIPASDQEELVGADGLFGFSAVASSQDLKSIVGAGTLTINDGTEDLDASDGLKHISFESLYQDQEQDAALAGANYDDILVDGPTVVVLVDDDSFDVLTNE